MKTTQESPTQVETSTGSTLSNDTIAEVLARLNTAAQVEGLPGFHMVKHAQKRVGSGHFPTKRY